MKEMMIDIETLGTKPDSVIIQIGAIMFNKETGETFEEFYINVSAQSCLDKGLTVTENTIFFWMKQNETVQNTLLNPKPLILIEALVKLKLFYNQNYPAKVWCNLNFDAPILESAFNACCIVSPFKYYELKDIRTLSEFFTVDRRKFESENMHHNALEDCKVQIKVLVEQFSKIKKAKDLHTFIENPFKYKEDYISNIKKGIAKDTKEEIKPDVDDSGASVFEPDELNKVDVPDSSSKIVFKPDELKWKPNLDDRPRHGSKETKEEWIKRKGKID